MSEEFKIPEPKYDVNDTMKYCSVRMRNTPRAQVSNLGNIHQQALDPNCHNVFATCHGGIMLISDRIIIPGEDVADARAHGVCAYQGVDFVTISKKDAENLTRMIWQAAIKLSGTTETEFKNHDIAYDVFGNSAASFECLLDRLNGELYPPECLIARLEINQKRSEEGTE